MKHNFKITLILVLMFVVTQIIGLFVISTYNNGLSLPYGMEPPEIEPEPSLTIGISSVLFAFTFAIILFVLLMKLNASTFIRVWYFVVTILALGLTFTALLFYLPFKADYSYLALLIAIPLAYIKIFKRNIYVHNISELLIYPGIGAVFVSFLFSVFGGKAVIGIVIFLILI